MGHKVDSYRLDREITIEQYTASQNDFGEELLTWSTFSECWCSAEWPAAHNDEGQEAQQETATESVNLIVRWIDANGVEPKMRALFEGRYYDILGVTLLGRQRYIHLRCEHKD